MRIGFNPEKDKVKKVDDFFQQVIMPLYISNHEGYFKDSFKMLKYCLESLFKTCHSKSYTNIEILLIDDGSSDNYAEAICNKLSNYTYFYKENGGLSSARNYGINLSKGEYIAFLDNDDFWESSKIEKQVKVLLENSSIDCVHSAAAVVDEKGMPTGEFIGAAQNKIHKRSGCVFWNALGTWVVK